MELPNTHFENFPIEFKEINPEDFPYFEVGEKIIISPNQQGYINEVLQEKINRTDKNTVVINAAVGQGKTYSIIDIAYKYFRDSEEYVIFIASPYVSLVEQYYNAVIAKGIPESDVFRYDKLGESNLPDYKEQRVHIVTANCLLGNPGEDAFINSDIKRVYLRTLSDYCKRNRKKTIFIYDEVHDTIHNFKEKFIFNLWKWRDTILKNYIISATFNEASKPVIEYLAELTENKIQIIESERIRFPNKQSELYLHYNSAHNYKSDDKNITKLVQKLITRGKEVDILCYSKNLADDIIDDRITGVGAELYRKYLEINRCTSELISNQISDGLETPRDEIKNRYNPNMCNVGTNFKTGISIEKENHAFVIIMPPRGTKMPYQSLYGIFTSGINSVIQALARQRKKGEIHIVLPRPDEFDYRTLPFETDIQKESFKESYNLIEHYEPPKNRVKYYKLSEQDSILENFYEREFKNNVRSEISHISSTARDNKMRLDFPEFKLFKLEDGEDYLANKIHFFGNDLSAYITYCAFTNQFINCKLANISYQTPLFFRENEIRNNLNYIFSKYFGESYLDTYTTIGNFTMFYEAFRNTLFRDFIIRYLKTGQEKWILVRPYSNSDFETQLLEFCGMMYFGRNYSHQDYTRFRHIDIPYTRSQYFLDSISVAESIDLEECDYPDFNKNIIRAYKQLGIYRRKLIDNIGTTTRGEIFNYLPNNVLTGFISEEEQGGFNTFISTLIEIDPFLKNNIFDLKRNIEGKPIISKIKSFYKILVDDFFEIPQIENYPKVTINGRRQNVKPIESTIPLPNSQRVINVLVPARKDQNYLTNLKDFVEGALGEDYNDYEDKINSILDN